MIRSVGQAATCAAVCLFLAAGCGPRAEVAKARVLGRIDDALGAADVRRAEIDAGMAATQQAVEGVRKAKITAQVRLDRIDEAAKPFEERVGHCDRTPARLRDLLKADRPADIAGKTYTPDGLREMAGKLLQARREAEDRVGGFRAAREGMGKVVAELSRRQHALEARLANLRTQVARLEAETAAARALKEAAAATGGEDASPGAGLDRLEEKLAWLAADVRAELREEEEKWREATAERAVEDVDAVIRGLQKPADLSAEIDRVLGGIR